LKEKVPLTLTFWKFYMEKDVNCDKVEGMQPVNTDYKPTIIRRPFLYSIHSFRAFAIVNVILLHLWSMPAQGRFPEAAALIGHVRESLFHDATFYFLFISGFLFQYLSSGFQLKRFYRNKASFVLAPYLILSTVAWVPLAATLVSGAGGLEALRRLGLTLIQGTAQPQYWYIPFILSLYLFSPLLLKLPPRLLTGLGIAAAFLPLLGTRTGTLLTIGQYLYFAPAFLGGIVVSLHYDRCLVWMRRWAWALWTVGIGTSVWLFFLCSSNLQQAGLYEAVHYVNKAALTFAILDGLTCREHLRSRVLDNIAQLSFALYFLHSIKGREIDHWVVTPLLGILPNVTPAGVVLLASLVIAIVRLAILLGICAGLKRVLGRFSRYVIGA